MKAIRFSILLVLAVIIAACSATPTRRAFKEGWRDCLITSRVKWKMGRDKLVKAHNIDVDTWRGVVTITGRTTSEEEKARAEEVSQGVKNVVQVRNYIDVVGSESVTPKMAEGKAPFSKPTGRYKSVKEMGVATAPPAAPATPPAAPVTTKASKEAKEATSGVTERDLGSIKMPAQQKHESGVSYQIRKDLAATGDHEEDVTRQAQEELKELKEKRQGAGSKKQD